MTLSPARLLAGLTPLCLALLFACNGRVDVNYTGGDGGLGGGDPGSDAGDDDGWCSDAHPCAHGGICIFPVDQCSASAVGTCLGAFSCDGPPPGPVCLCSGEIGDGCVASRTASAAHCSHGTFPCGDKACKQNLEACVDTAGGPSGEPVYECKTPHELEGSTCGDIPACSCLMEVAWSVGCMAGADGQVTIDVDLP